VTRSRRSPRPCAASGPPAAPRDENGRNFSRTVPFHFLYFPVRFRICEIPFSYLRK
jgi:hypothetical protein